MSTEELANVLLGNHERLGAYNIPVNGINGTVNKKKVVTVKVSASFLSETGDLRDDLKGKWILFQIVEKPATPAPPPTQEGSDEA